MADISTQSVNDGIMERRVSERRARQRRNASAPAGHYNGAEKRAVHKERRTTIVNRLKREVTDRRSLN
jgi:hypothetical protein